MFGIDLTENFLAKVCRCENPDPKWEEGFTRVIFEGQDFEIPPRPQASCKKCGKPIPGLRRDK